MTGGRRCYSGEGRRRWLGLRFPGTIYREIHFPRPTRVCRRVAAAANERKPYKADRAHTRQQQWYGYTRRGPSYVISLPWRRSNNHRHGWPTAASRKDNRCRPTPRLSAKGAQTHPHRIHIFLHSPPMYITSILYLYTSIYIYMI